MVKIVEKTSEFKSTRYGWVARYTCYLAGVVTFVVLVADADPLTKAPDLLKKLPGISKLIK